MTYILAIDQGTTSTRAILFDENMDVAAKSQIEFDQHFPASGWVEHNPNDIWSTTLATCKNVIDELNISATKIAAIGIANQRETTLVWDKVTGEPIYNAIVWQDRRTADMCETLKAQGHEAMITKKTGLILDPYFSATKLSWILENVQNAKQKALNGELLFGTVDSYLIWKLTNGKQHLTDATNAARTMLYNIKDGCWDAGICDLLNIPMDMLPKVKDNAADFGKTALEFFDHKIPISAVIGDQQGATVGQACFEAGMIKSTYGTGCFMLLNTGDRLVYSKNKLLSTIAYQLNGKTTYALEGSIFNAGTVVSWLRDGLGIIDKPQDAEILAKQAKTSENVYFVPAFTGLGAPYWDANSRGAILGLTRNSGKAEIAKAALQSVGYQTRDLIDAMFADWQQESSHCTLRVDGGMANSNWTMQFLSDILAAPVDRPNNTETTALGVAWLAGMYVGIYPNQQAYASGYKTAKQFNPSMDKEKRTSLYQGWKKAIYKTIEN